MNKLTRMPKSIYCALLMSILLVTHAQASDYKTDTNWVLTGTSNVDRSTKFISNGYLDAGIRYANKALASPKKTLVEEVIAQHNLCVALNAQGNSAAAAPHCRMANELPKPQVALKQVKEGLFKVTKRGKDKGMFANLMAQNLSAIKEARIVQKGQDIEIKRTN